MNGNEYRDFAGQHGHEDRIREDGIGKDGLEKEMGIDAPWSDVPEDVVAAEDVVEIPVERVDEETDAAAGCGGADVSETPLSELGREELEEKLEQTRAQMDALKKACEDEIRDIRMRGQAELENFKKRLGREHTEHLKFAAENVMKELVPSLDNLELAITYGAKDEACQNLLQGVEMTWKLLLEAVGRHGLSRVGTAGDPFDPALHEAIGTESRDDMEENAVSRVLQSGYSLHDRLLRPAKVMVNKR